MRTNEDLRKRVEVLYDRFYSRALAVIKKDNPCQVKREGVNVVCAECIDRRKPESIHFIDDAKPNTLCCIRCEHHNPKKGCQADRPLACKLWLCQTAKKLYPEAAAELDKISTEAHEVFGTLCFRGDRKQTVDHIIRSDMNVLQELKMNIMIFDETVAGWVANHGHACDSMNAKSFGSIAEAREFCDKRADLDRHRIVLSSFLNREVVGARRMWAGHSLPEV